MVGTHRSTASVIFLWAAMLGIAFITGPEVAFAMPEAQWAINENGYFEAQGCSVLLYHNRRIYHQGGLEIIHHGERVAGRGDVHLELASGRWAGRREVGERQIDRETGEIAIPVRYVSGGIGYTVRVRAQGQSLRLRIDLDRPLDPQEMAEACFSLELYPPAYFARTFHLGHESGIFPREVNRKMVEGPERGLTPAPMATGSRLVIAPEDPVRWLEIEQTNGEMSLMDNRNDWYQGWFEVRGEVAADRTEGALEWVITPHRIPGWRRQAVISISQVGYHPDQAKRAVIELDPEAEQEPRAYLLRIDPTEGVERAYSGPALEWGSFLRYQYRIFDFSEVRDPGVYCVEYGEHRSDPFRIDRDVFRHGVWQPTLETFFPIQMCHTKVMDKDRVWHGACHLDDALQAPVSHEHCDQYRQGPETETAYEPYEHIPHLNVGGWHDAADTDLAAGSQARTTLLLALAREEFGVDFDRTTVRKEDRLVVMYEPDGIPDLVQQVAWGAECLLGGYRAAGHSFSGIIEGSDEEYLRGGDPSARTDALIYDSSLSEDLRENGRSGTMDDRWAFTSRDTSLEYLVAAALAAASRVLRGYEDHLAGECLAASAAAWEYEQSHSPSRQRSAYVPGNAEAQEVLAAVELLVATGEQRYRERLIELLPAIEDDIWNAGWAAARAVPYVGDGRFAAGVRTAIEGQQDRMKELLSRNPFGVPFHRGMWGSAWPIQEFGVRNYYLLKAYPELLDREHVLSTLNYVLGCHPASSTSLVSGVGTRSRTTCVGCNLTGWLYTPGGGGSGPVVIGPDFPELKEDWPYLWTQTEYVIHGAAHYIFLVLAAQNLLDADRT